jgi:adenylate cyclase class 1
MKKVIKANRFAQEVQMIKQRFLDINEGKLQRLITGLSRKQSPFLQVLPLLFHVNHPALPGYQSKQVAKGIQHYKPNKAALSAVPGGAQRFDLFSRPVLNADILALYIMGSCGTLAQGVRSDLDIWLVHAPDLSEEALGLLQQKAQLIEKWAKKYNLEVHFFLMDPQAFKGGQVGVLSDEDSGSSQHHLLLDEFYRSCILLAGCYPVWWLVPPEQEQNYEAYLLQLAQQAHLGYKETIDFGALPKVPHQEVVGAALWQLHKGVHSPYK